MTDRNRFKTCARGSNYRGVSRRDVLRVGGAISAAGILLPAWVTAVAQSATTFDYYVSPTGSDSNPGTVASPWAVTSVRVGSANFSKFNGVGKRIGFMPGTYDVSSLVGNQESNGALQFPGGTSGTPNYYGSCDASGNYSARTATLDMKGASGLFGGHAGGSGNFDGPLIAHVGTSPNASYTVGNCIIDGLILTGFSFKGIRVGGASSGDGPAITAPVTIQNCEFTGGGHNAGDGLDNSCSVWLDGCTGATVTNCFFYNNAPWASASEDHLNAIICWQCKGTLIQYNTCYNAGNIYGKVEGNQGTTIQYNYLDCSMYTIESYGMQDFTGATSSGLTQTTTIRNNIILATLVGVGRPTLSDSYGWTTPLLVFNNTFISSSPGMTAIWGTTASGGSLQWYNNIVTGTTNSSYGNFLANPAAPKLWDYNLFAGSGMTWVLRQNGSLASSLASYSSATSFASGLASNGGISGAEAHSVTGSPSFANTGTYAALYQLAAGSAGKGAGSTTGTSSGTACDMGAWGNGATQIGCSFSPGTSAPSPVPSAPVLSVS